MDRLDLHDKLLELIGNPNVYFNPPETKKLDYPCFVYKLNNMDKKNANNKPYLKFDSYTVTLICSDPDNDLKDKLAMTKGFKFDRPLVVDNLYHYVYTYYQGGK